MAFMAPTEPPAEAIDEPVPDDSIDEEAFAALAEEYGDE